MSGHSKWSKVKHQKEVTDSAKGKIFTKIAKAIAVAIKESGGNADPNFNFKLRLAIEKARSVNMPKENITRAVDHGKGIGEGAHIEEAIYEGFGPAGIGLLIKTATDNRQRTVSEIKNTLDRGGGVLATSGAVSHLFMFVGLIHVKKDQKTFDEMFEAALGAGADDLEDEGDDVAIYTNHADVHRVKEALTQKGFTVTNFELYYRPQMVIPVLDQALALRLIKLLSLLEELDDVQKVYTNAQVSDEALP